MIVPFVSRLDCRYIVGGWLCLSVWYARVSGYKLFVIDDDDDFGDGSCTIINWLLSSSLATVYCSIHFIVETLVSCVDWPMPSRHHRNTTKNKTEQSNHTTTTLASSTHCCLLHANRAKLHNLFLFSIILHLCAAGAVSISIEPIALYFVRIQFSTNDNLACFRVATARCFNFRGDSWDS